MVAGMVLGCHAQARASRCGRPPLRGLRVHAGNLALVGCSTCSAVIAGFVPVLIGGGAP
jgi:hypothetical protein